MKSQTLTYVQTAATLAMAGAAVAVAVSYVFASLRAAGEYSAGANVTIAEEEWDALAASGARVGSTNAGVVIVEFVDFQCPFCRQAHAAVDSLLSEHSTSVALVVHHLPLSIHPQAVAAAIVAECGREQGRFREIISAIFDNQAKLRERDWRSYAEAAGVPNMRTFASCVERPVESFEIIARGRELAGRYGITSTPTFLIRGKRYQAHQLRPIVKELLDG